MLSRAKKHMRELREHLDAAYGQCMKHLDEAGLGVEAEDDDGGRIESAGGGGGGGGDKETGGSAATTTAKSGGGGEKADAAKEGRQRRTPEELDAAREFLRKKGLESHAHLMMFWESEEAAETWDNVEYVTGMEALQHSFM